MLYRFVRSKFLDVVKTIYKFIHSLAYCHGLFLENEMEPEAQPEVKKKYVPLYQKNKNRNFRAN